MEYLKVRNWDRWQYRGDRNLPWIKLYRDLLLDPDFLQLTDAERGHLVSLWLTASAKNGCIPRDPCTAQRLINSQLAPDLERFLSLQFFETIDKRRRRGSQKHGAPNREDKRREDLGAFEEFWSAYPKRAGGNSKADALRAWTARLKGGADPQEIIAGCKRYAAFIEATGRTRTEFVKQAATFLGPGQHWDQPWEPPPKANGMDNDPAKEWI